MSIANGRQLSVEVSDTCIVVNVTLVIQIEVVSYIQYQVPKVFPGFAAIPELPSLTVTHSNLTTGSRQMHTASSPIPSPVSPSKVEFQVPSLLAPP